jgi:hypothetical protein
MILNITLNLLLLKILIVAHNQGNFLIFLLLDRIGIKTQRNKLKFFYNKRLEFKLFIFTILK